MLHIWLKVLWNGTLVKYLNSLFEFNLSNSWCMTLEKIIDEKPEIRKTGTTTVGMICREGVVLAAEKNPLWGSS